MVDAIHAAEGLPCTQEMDFPFTKWELQQALSRTKPGKAISKDCISADFILHIPFSFNEYLLHIFNESWTKGAFLSHSLEEVSGAAITETW